MARLIGDLTDIGRIDTGQLAIEPTPHDPELIAREVVEILHPQAIERGSRLEAKCEGGIPHVLCDGDRIVQALSNLVSNAVKVGAPTVTVRVEPHTPNEVVFSVIDSGPGIPSEDLAHMFELLARPDQHLQGHRSRTGNRAWHRDGARRPHLGRERSRGGFPLPLLAPAAGRRGVAGSRGGASGQRACESSLAPPRWLTVSALAASGGRPSRPRKA